jgi:hypothetical protein
LEVIRTKFGNSLDIVVLQIQMNQRFKVSQLFHAHSVI